MHEDHEKDRYLQNGGSNIRLQTDLMTELFIP